MSREVTRRDLAYDFIAADWDDFVNRYDTNRRIEVLIGEFIADRAAGRRVLDAGCGLGDFSRRLAELGPGRHVAVDIAPGLIRRLGEALPCIDARTADLLDLRASLGEEQFDIVLSSEVVEHTPDPILAVRNLCARVAPGGLLVFSCPNASWKWLLHLARALRLRRRYQGYENWLWGSRLVTEVERCGLDVRRREGIHLVPWQIVPKRALRLLDQAVRRWSFGWSINHAILAERPRRRAPAPPA